MVRTTFSGREIVAVLFDFGYEPVSRSGSHVRLRYENDDTRESET
jgi:predicted RNA binding protein YcfA (HicA-like mRNA interferase family)